MKPVWWHNTAASALANGKLMTDIEPRFFDTEYKIFAHLEWEAIRMIVFNGTYEYC